MEYGQVFYLKTIQRTSLDIVLAIGILFMLGCEKRVEPKRAYDAARIVSLAPSLTETLYALGLGERLVGVSSFCKYPPQVKELPKVGGFIDTDFEAIVRLNPSCVLVTASEMDTAERLRGLGIDVLEVPLRDFADIRDSFVFIGERLGCVEQGRNVRQTFMDRLNRESGRRRTGILVIWREYGNGKIGDVQVAGPKSIYAEIANASGVDLLPETDIAYPTLSPEVLLRLDPDVIYELLTDCKDSQIAKDDWKKSLPQLKAVKNNAIHIVSEDYAVIPGPRFTQFSMEY